MDAPVTFQVFDLTSPSSWQTPIRVPSHRPGVDWFRRHMTDVPPGDVEPDRVVAVQLFSDAEGMRQHRRSIREWLGKHHADDEPLYMLFFRQKKLSMVYMGCICISITRGADITDAMFLTLDTHPVRGHIESLSLSGVTSIDEACAKAWIEVSVVGSSESVDQDEGDDNLQTLGEALARVQSHPESALLSWMAASMIVKGATWESKKTALKKWILATVHHYHGKMLSRTIDIGIPLTMRLDEDTSTPVPWGRMAVSWSYPLVTVTPTSSEDVDALRVAEWMRLWKSINIPWRNQITDWCDMIQSLPGEVVSTYRHLLHHLVHPWVTEKVARHMEVAKEPWLDAAAAWTLSELSANAAWNVALDTCQLTATPVNRRGDPTSGISLERIVEELHVTEEEASEIWAGAFQDYPDFLSPWIDAVLVRGELKYDARLVWSTLIVYISQARASMDVDAETSLQDYLQLMFASWMVYVGSHSPEHTLTKERMREMADLVKGKLRRCIEHEHHLTPGMSHIKTQCGSPEHFWRAMMYWARSH